VVNTVRQRAAERLQPAPSICLTNDPDLHLLVDGKRVDGVKERIDTYAFRLAKVPESGRLVSRASVPSELGLERDARQLGVAVRRMVLWRGRTLRLIDAADDALQEGFHQFEADNGLRWTDGDALLPAALVTGLRGSCILVIEVACVARYVVFGDTERDAT
jgi:hypothetical protein